MVETDGTEQQVQSPLEEAQAEAPETAQNVSMSKAELDAMLLASEKRAEARVRSAMGRERANNRLRNSEGYVEQATQRVVSQINDIPEEARPAINELINAQRYSRQAQVVMQEQARVASQFGLDENDLAQAGLEFDPEAPAKDWILSAQSVAAKKYGWQMKPPTTSRPQAIDTGLPAGNTNTFRSAQDVYNAHANGDLGDPHDPRTIAKVREQLKRFGE